MDVNTKPFFFPGGPPALDEAFITAAHARIAEAMPAVADLTPDVRPRPPHVLLVYTQETPLPEGASLTRITRATLDAEGKVVKLSTSRG